MTLAMVSNSREFEVMSVLLNSRGKHYGRRGDKGLPRWKGVIWKRAEGVNGGGEGSDKGWKQMGTSGKGSSVKPKTASEQIKRQCSGAPTESDESKKKNEAWIEA